jgi:hypothetical protein
MGQEEMFDSYKIKIKEDKLTCLLCFCLWHLAVSFTKIFAPSGRIFWEVVANDLPPFLRKRTLRNGVRAS